MQRHAVNVPTEFYARFTKDVVKLAQEEDVAVDGRVISVLEGGYSDRALTSGVLSHLSGLTQQPLPGTSSETEEMVNAIQRMNIAAMGLEKPAADPASTKNVPEYDVDWWHMANLTALENYITPPPPPPPVAKRAQRPAMPTYATPTESFTQKVINPEDFKRSISGTMRSVLLTNTIPSTQPPPEVDWIVATHELSKLLIPTDRQTRSCKPEELAAPRVKKERLSGPASIPVDTGRQLRGRKTKTPPNGAASPTLDLDDITEAMRRQTISDVPTSSDPAPDQAAKRVTRRSSAIFLGAATKELDPVFVPPVPQIPTTAASTKLATQPVAKSSTQPSSNSSTQLSAAPKARKTVRATATKPPSASTTVKPTQVTTVKSHSQASVPRPVSRTNSLPRSDNSTAAGPKRITLKLGTREESQRKVQERIEAEKRKKKAQKSNRLREGSATPTQEHGKPSSLRPLATQTAQPQDTALIAEENIKPSFLEYPYQEGNLPLQASPIDTTDSTSSSQLTTEVEQATSPPIFTPTFMSQVHTPTENRSRSTSAVTAGRNEIPIVGEVRYEFIPRPKENGHDPSTTQTTLKSLTAAEIAAAATESTAFQAMGVKREELPVFTPTGAIPFAPAFAARDDVEAVLDGARGLGITSPINASFGADAFGTPKVGSNNDFAGGNQGSEDADGDLDMEVGGATPRPNAMGFDREIAETP